MAEKYRYAECILYPDSMIGDWQDRIDDLIQLPFAYCKHDKDECKSHVHLILIHNNTVALSFFQKWCNIRLSREGCLCCSTVEPVLNPQRAWDYLIHNTPTARKEGKYQNHYHKFFLIQDTDICPLFLQ